MSDTEETATGGVPYEPVQGDGVRYPTDKYVGDPDFRERQFTDTHGWLPPLYETDAFTKAARTNADESIEELVNASVAPRFAGQEPGETEMSWGKGLMVPLDKGPGPTDVEYLKAVQRTNPADPAASHIDRYADWIRER